jgi:uncharacterized oligopeptide transporter (OPT) family protein
MMQDLKAGHILGCTPWKMQVGDIFGVTSAALAMFLILSVLHIGDLKRATGQELDRLQSAGTTTIESRGKSAGLASRTFTIDEVRALSPEEQNDVLGTNAGFGGEKLPAPQASLMAVVARGIIESKTEMILIVVGMFMGLAFILMQVKSPMLIAVGMYLPIDTSFAIFLGGLMKGAVEFVMERRKLDAPTREKVGNIGVLLSSGLIAGEALLGLLFAGLAFGEIRIGHVFAEPSYLVSLACIGIIALLLIRVPIGRGK